MRTGINEKNEQVNKFNLQCYSVSLCCLIGTADVKVYHFIFRTI